MELAWRYSWAPASLGSLTAAKSSLVKKGDGVLFRASAEDDDEFEKRLERLRRKGASGTGKKAEERKAKQEGSPSPAAAVPSTSVTPLKPLPLEDPVVDGLPVVLGFTPFSERINGRFAALGIAALILVELVSGESLLKFHDPATLLLQIYTLLGAGAVAVKLYKEKNAVWPKA